MNRAYSLLELKAVNDDERIIEGIASTPTPDRGGDIMEPKGALYQLPMPFLWHHNQQNPIGEVFEAKVTADGIRIKARIASVDEPGTLKDRLDEAWQSIKAKLVRGLSIGWNPVEWTRKDDGGMHVYKWHWGELSAVTVPMNLEATILKVKELDLAASGLSTPGVSGLPVVTALKGANAMTVAEQITQFENTRAAKVARMTTIMTKAAENNTTLDQPESDEHDTLTREVDAIDAHLLRLKAMEKTLAAGATPITAQNTQTASDQRGGQPVITVKANVPKGTALVRSIMAKAAVMRANGGLQDAIHYAQGQRQWMDQTPEVVDLLKAAVNPGTVTDALFAAPLAVTQPINEFLELLRPETLIGKIPGLRNVPSNVSVPVQTGGGTYTWVGEAAPKPVGNLQLQSVTLAIAKAAGIIVISEELARKSTPSAEAVVRNDMVKGMAQYLDQQFITPSVSAVSGVSPASITNAANGYGSAGTSGDNARTDLKKGINLMVTENYPISELVFIMSEANAFAIAAALTSNGVPLFPNMSIRGGSILGVPVVTSQSAGSTVATVHAPSILFTDEGGLNIDVSREASVEMNTTPTSPVAAATVLVSLWQQNLIGLRAERFINWKRVRTKDVVYTTATYI